ncbi:MAG: hypothetical protein JW726_11540 [Anaerolineales bacterium]|nr:hypothetical protein [Anaerolineales bacterium]
MAEKDLFWEYLERLVTSSRIVIDRPKGSTHPRFTGRVYPLDYGYLDETMTTDGGGVDVWVGSLSDRRVVGALATVDLGKRDTELKILIGCTVDEMNEILEFVNGKDMRAFLIWRGV